MTKHGVQSHISRNVHDAVILDSVSCLLSPVLKYEGDSGDVDENKGRRKKVSGIRCQESGKSPKPYPGKYTQQTFCLLSPDSCLLFLEK